MDYKQTLNLPQTDFPMKADLARREPEIQRRWHQMNLYEKSLEKDAPKGLFLLHDGPPYSNGNLHLGHALNKILKDIVVKFRTLQGYRAPYVPGWDNHGLPIEVQVVKEFRDKKETWTPATLRARCRTFAAEWVQVQKAQFQRLGVRGDWENPYLTMDPRFEAKIVETFAEMAKKGYVYRSLKPVLWDPANETALANTEAEYKDHVSPAIYVAFPLAADTNGVFTGLENLRAVIWTTTPWTIPANLALAFHPDFDYAVVRTEKHGLLLIAESLRARVAEHCDFGAYETVKTLTGRDIENTRFRHPLPEMDRDSVAVLADYVTAEDGTGIVHTAPGHGTDDYLTGRKYDLPILSPLDARGRYTEEAGNQLAGLSTDQANIRVPELLTAHNALLAKYDYAHSYPHSPRAPYKPLLFRATVQWFVRVDHDALRERALAGIKTVEWFPAQAENRITAAIAGRPDWTVSRQRHWGVPIPIFYANDEPVLDPAAFAAVVTLIQENGVEAWYQTPPEAILPDGYTFNSVPAREFTKETDVLDVWFDSGSTGLAVLASDRWPYHRWPADLYLEGSDQHRGWFNSSLLIGTALQDSPPYRQVVTNGFTVNEQGDKMSKSKGNAVDPLGVTETVGADVLRLWVGSIEYQEDMRLNEPILKQITETYRSLRNTFRFLLGNLYDFDPAADTVDQARMDPLDRWALSRLQRVVAEVTAHNDRYDFHQATQAILVFCNTELSAFYLDVLKDRLYTALPDGPERRSAQTALLTICSTLCRLLAPVLSHTCEDVWSFLPGENTEKAMSVQLADWPVPDPQWTDEALESDYQEILALREEFNRKLETARAEKTLNRSTETEVQVRAGANKYARLAPLRAQAEVALIVPKLTLENDDHLAPDALDVTVRRAPGTKCERSWFVREDVGADPEHPTISAAQAQIVRALSPN